MVRGAAGAAASGAAAPPWPQVGCVIVRDGEIVGAGATGPFPVGPHAEVAALRVAGDRARGATAYTTLEPCNHHGNTPPCTEALIDAGVARVVIAVARSRREGRRYRARAAARRGRRHDRRRRGP